MSTTVMLTRRVVLDALRRLEDRHAGGERIGDCFDWNPNWTHGFPAKDVAAELRLSFGFPNSLRWPTVLPFLKELAAQGEIVEVKVGSRQKKLVPLYRTVGG